MTEATGRFGTIDGFYLPPRFARGRELEVEEVPLPDGPTLRQLRVTPELVRELAAYLKGAARLCLKPRPVRELVALLDAAAGEWLRGHAPDHEAVMAGMAAATGLTPAMVEESLRIEQVSSRAQDMEAALTAELGTPEVLDRFVTRPLSRARVRALGPELIFGVLPGNIPALSHLSFMRALLVKAPLLGKTATDEPVYAAAYARTLARLDAGAGECVAALYWPGGDEAIEAEAFAAADAVIAYGTAETCRDVARRARPGTRLVLHGHKLGFALVGRAALAGGAEAELARRLAYDIAMFDQQACLSPHWIFVEGASGRETHALGEALAEALRRVELPLPRGRVPTGEAVAFGRAWDDAELAVAMGEPVVIHSRRGEDAFLVRTDHRRPLAPSCLGRAVSLVPVKDADALAETLAPFAGYFQNAAVEAPSEGPEKTAERLASLGVSRICRPGRMATPTMMWHHDGRPCLEELVRYCDLELEDAPLVRATQRLELELRRLLRVWKPRG